MLKFLIAAIIITLNSVNLFAADVPFPDDKLRALPVHVRYDAKRLYDETYHLFATGRDLGTENAYKLLFKGLIFGQTFGFTIDTDKLLSAALKKLVSKKEFQGSKIFFSKITSITHHPKTKKSFLPRPTQRNDFKSKFDSVLDPLYKEGNIYALFIKGLLEYDEATDSHRSVVESVEKLELAAHHFCLPALNFCDWLYGNRGSGNKIHKMKLDNITQNDPAYNSAYFEPFLYIIDLIKNPFEVAYHIDFENSSSCPNFIGGSKVYPSGLPVINVLDKIKKSIMLTIDDSAKEHYERVSEKLTTSAGETRRLQPARKKYERAALVLVGTAGSVGGAFSSHLSTAGSIITTTASISLTLYGAYKMLSVSPVCYGDQSHIDGQIELLSMYLALKENRNFVRDAETVLDVFKLGMDDHWCNKFDRFIRRDQLTLSQMVLKKAG